MLPKWDAEAAAEIARIQQTVIDPALRASQDEARGIAQALLDRTKQLHEGIVSAWASMGKDAASAFNKAFTDEYGRGLGIPGLPAVPQQRNYLPAPMAQAGGTTVIVNGLNVQTLTESERRTFASMVLKMTMGSAGDLAMQEERRMTGGSPVA